MIKDNYVSLVTDFNTRLRERQASLGLLNEKKKHISEQKQVLGPFSFTKGRHPRRLLKTKTNTIDADGKSPGKNLWIYRSSDDFEN